LPTRRWRPETKDWIVPARAAHLRAVLDLVGQVEERAIAVDLDPSIHARLKPLGLTRVLLQQDGVELVGPYDEDRVHRLRELPERRFDKRRKSWLVPLTREGAIGVLRLVASDDSYVVTANARAALERTALPRTQSEPDDTEVREGRGVSPQPHWRFVTTGAVFNAPHARRVRAKHHNGNDRWGVYVRVDPTLTPDRRRQINSNPPTGDLDRSSRHGEAG
jgi:hypothetical protein